MAGNSRDEKIKYVFETDGAEKLGAIEKTLGGIAEKSLGTETAFSFVKQHLEELTVAAMALGAAFKGIEFGKESIANAAAAEASLSRLRAVAGDVATQFTGMDDALSKAAQSVNVDTQTSVAGLTALLGAGLQLKDGMDALVPTLQLAKIANVDVGTAAETVAKTLAAFNLPASAAQKVVDELATASHGAAGGLSAMSEATSRLAPDAKAIGLSFEDLAGIVGTLGQRGITGKQAMSGLRDIFQELQDPTSKLRLTLSALGDDSADFGHALTTLSSGSPRAQEALLGLNGSARSVIQSLGADGPQAIERFVAGLNNASGSASKTAHALDDNLSGAWKKFGLSVDDIGEKLAKPVLTPFKEELEKLADALTKFADSPDFKEIEEQIGVMAKNAAKALDDFLKNVDWKTFLADGKATLSGLAEGFEGVASKASAAASAIGTAFNIIDGAYQALGVAIDGAVHVAAKGIDGLAQVSMGATYRMSELHNVMQDVADTAGDQMVERMDKLGNIMGTAADATDKATGSTARNATATKQATAEAAAHTAATAADADAQKQAASAADAAALAQQKAAQETKKTAAAAAEAAEALKPLADRLRDFEASGERAASAAGAIKSAFATLRIVSQADLEATATAAAKAFGTIDAASDNTARGLADKQNAFIAYAKAALAASANLDEGTRASTQYMLESKAASLGVLDALKKMEQAGKRAGDSVSDGAERGASALRDEAAAAGEAAGAIEDAGDRTRDMAADGGESLANLTQAMADTRAAFLAISEAAAKAFDARLLSDWNLAFDSTGANLGKTVEAMNNAAAQTSKEIEAQRGQLQGMIDSITAGSKMSISAIDGMIESIKNGTYQFGILGKQDLAPLLAALDAAKQKTEAAERAAAEAAQRFDQLAQSIHDQLLQERGDEAALEDERHKNQMQALADAAAAGKIDQAKYQQAVADENALHDLKMKHMQEQQQQEKAAAKSSGGAGGGSSSGAGSSSGTSRNDGGSSGAASAGGAAAVSGGVPMTINYPGRTLYLTLGTPAQADGLEGLIQEIARQRANSINK